MTDRPWDDPAATGYGRRVSEEEYAIFVRQSVAAAQKSTRSVLGRESGIFHVLIQFAERNSLFPQRHDWHGGEIWSFGVGHERLERSVVVRVKHADWFEGWMFDIRSEASWVGDPKSTYVVDKEYRWFGASSLCSPSAFLEMLEMSLDDAKRYTIADLHPAPWPANASFQRHF